MRFIEIANPEDQLALWRMVSNSMWKAFGEPNPEASMSNNQQFKPIQAPGVKAVSTPSMMNQPLAHGIHGVSSISGTGGKKPKTNRPIKVPKPKKAPMAPAPKPLPKPRPQVPTSQQIKNQQLRAQQEYATQVRKELTKKPIEPHPGAPKPLSGNIISPIDIPRNTKEREQLKGQARGELPWKPI